MAAIICVGPLVLILGGVVAFTWPEVHMVPMFIALGAGGLLLPILLYPSSYTTWQAVDILMRPVEPEHFESGHTMSPDAGQASPTVQ